MNILMIGDVVAHNGVAYLRKVLPPLRRERKIDLVIANGENSADGNGITPESADELFLAGVDIITTGNHAFRRREIYDLMDSEPYLLRPANYPAGTVGKGWCIYDMGRVQVCVANLIGTAYMESMDCPFRTADRILAETADAQIHIFDFHAESSGEKRALGFYLDGRASIVAGTHTHVQTADASVLPHGTGYITDLGMTGPIQSVLGVKPELIIAKMKQKMPVRFETADGDPMMNGVLFRVDEHIGQTVQVERFDIRSK